MLRLKVIQPRAHKTACHLAATFVTNNLPLVASLIDDRSLANLGPAQEGDAVRLFRHRGLFCSSSNFCNIQICGFFGKIYENFMEVTFFKSKKAENVRHIDT
jgi:hypothetical protein